ncbi:hypothetical protein [Aliarcobacter vitoriensis]|nr:hypothetical protein [Aliarcobacter vitoriensis]
MRTTSKKQKTKTEFKVYDELLCVIVLIVFGLFAYEMLLKASV